jgi:hypothetical protein
MTLPPPRSLCTGRYECRFSARLPAATEFSKVTFGARVCLLGILETTTIKSTKRQPTPPPLPLSIILVFDRSGFGVHESCLCWFCSYKPLSSFGKSCSAQSTDTPDRVKAIIESDSIPFDSLLRRISSRQEQLRAAACHSCSRRRCSCIVHRLFLFRLIVNKSTAPSQRTD